MRAGHPMAAICVLFVSSIAWGEGTCRIPADGFALEVGPDAATIVDDAGTRLFAITGFRMEWMPQRMVGARVEPVGAEGARVEYRTTGEFADRMRLTATFTCRGSLVEVDYLLAVTDRDTIKGFRVGGTMNERSALVEASESIAKVGRWVRHEHGGLSAVPGTAQAGEPYEVRDAYFRAYECPTRTVWESVGGNINWGNAARQHVGLKQLADTGEARVTLYAGSVGYLVTPAGTSPEAAAALLHGRPLAISVSTGKPFNLWQTGTGQTPAFTVALTSTGRPALWRQWLEVEVHDYDGRAVLDESRRCHLPLDETRRFTFELPDASPGMYFVEARMREAPDEVFARTAIAVKEPYSFAHRGSSIFGMAAYFPVPSEREALELMHAIGVHYHRNRDNRKLPPEMGFVANHHDHYRPGEFAAMSESERLALIRRTLRKCRDQRNPIWEFGNENKIHQGNQVDAYVDLWLKPIAKIRREEGFDTRVSCIGFANGFGGLESLRAVHDAGGWPYFDVVAYHLGRGNFPPDTITTNSWNYLSSLRDLKALVGEYGRKPIWLTEIYACTKPNSWWHDSERLAAQNVILANALALAEGVQAALMYQLHDAVWHDVGGIRPADAEYHFGIVRRGGDPKPSLLAYFTAARALDGASFVEYLTFADTNIKGIRFRTPRGEMDVLWDRTEGYEHSKRSATHAWPDPWVEHWKKTRTVRFVSEGAEVVDCIGRTKSIEARDGAVELTLSGAPLIVYGLERARIAE